MSVIIAIKKDDVIYLGTDTRYSDGGNLISLLNENMLKIWKVEGRESCLMGQVGIQREASAIRACKDIIEETATIDFAYVVNYVEPRIREVLKEHEFIDVNDPYGTMKSRFILVSNDKMYIIDRGSVLEYDDFVAIGSSECEAFGSLVSTQNEKNPEKRILEALRVSAMHDVYVGAPFVLIDSKTMKYKIEKE